MPSVLIIIVQRMVGPFFIGLGIAEALHGRPWWYWSWVMTAGLIVTAPFLVAVALEAAPYRRAARLLLRIARLRLLLWLLLIVRAVIAHWQLAAICVGTALMGLTLIELHALLLVAPMCMIMGIPCTYMGGRAAGQYHLKAAAGWAGLVAVLYSLAALFDVLCNDRLAADVACVGAVFWLSVRMVW